MLINKKKVREYALAQAGERHHKFNRVSKEFLIHVDGVMRDIIKKHVHSLPSVGKTIK